MEPRALFALLFFGQKNRANLDKKIRGQRLRTFSVSFLMCFLFIETQPEEGGSLLAT